MSSFILLDKLVNMGFSESKAQKALEITGYQGVEPAMEWLLAFGETESIPESPVESYDHCDNDISIKCDDCGKIMKLRLDDLLTAKSDNDEHNKSMEVKKFLIKEKKTENIKELEEKLKQKIKNLEEHEKREKVKREREVVKAAMEMDETRKLLEQLQIKKLMEERMREHEEQELAKQKVLAQIEADKAKRRLKYGYNFTSIAASVAAANIQSVKKNYTETNLQIKFGDGKILTKKFNSMDRLSAVKLYIQNHLKNATRPFTLVTPLPKRVFKGRDYEMPLEVLGLVPSAVLMVDIEPY